MYSPHAMIGLRYFLSINITRSSLTELARCFDFQPYNTILAFI